MDKAAVQRIHEALSYPYGSIRLRADGYELSAQVRRVSSKSLRYAPCLFVDGWIKGENLRVDSEIGAKFYPLRTRQLFSAKRYAEHRKAFGKRAEADFRKRTTYQYREAQFRSGRALALHLKKTCKQVEIVEDATSGLTVVVERAP